MNTLLQNSIWIYLNTLYAKCNLHLKQLKFLSMGYFTDFSYNLGTYCMSAIPIYSNSWISIFVHHTGLWVYLGSKLNVSTVKDTGWWYLSLFHALLLHFSTG